MIDVYFVRYRIIIVVFEIIGKILGVGDDIRPVQFFEIAVIHQPERFFRELYTFIM